VVVAVMFRFFSVLSSFPRAEGGHGRFFFGFEQSPPLYRFCHRLIPFQGLLFILLNLASPDFFGVL